jgi:hypothetical protein
MGAHDSRVRVQPPVTPRAAEAHGLPEGKALFCRSPWVLIASKDNVKSKLRVEES